MKIRSWGTVAILLLLALSLAATADARPKQGDKTLDLGMTGFSWASGTEQACNEDGEDCEDTVDVSRMAIGLGGSAGYMLTDLFEAGLGLHLDYGKTTRESAVSGFDFEVEDTATNFGGGVYAKVHLGSSPTMVPFLAGGLGLDITGDKSKDVGKADDDEVTSGLAAFRVHLEGGFAYYVGEKYGITASARLVRLARAYDADTDDDDNDTSAYGEMSVRVGLGLTTYF